MQKKQILSKTIIIGSLIVAVLMTVAIVAIERQNKHDRLKVLMTNRVAQMQNSVDQALTEVYGIQTLVVGAGGKNLDLEKAGQFLIHNEYKEFVRNVLIAPGGIVSQVYPMDGNEAVVGLDLLSDANASNEDALKAMETNEVVVTGPFNMVQGGQAISARLKVSIPQKDGTLKDWGLVSISFSFPDVMKDTATDVLEDQGYAYRVIKRDDSTGTDKEIFAQSFSDSTDYESLDFSIKSMKYILEAYPSAGWVEPRFVIILFAGLFLTCILFAYVSLQINKRVTRLEQSAKVDALTTLLNRAEGEKQVNQIIHKGDYGKGEFLLVDIDQFKKVNDVLGHQMGDVILQENGRIFKSVFREDDIIFRLGGDEFIVFFTHNEDKVILDDKLKQLLRAMERTVHDGDKAVNISCSIGVSHAPENGATFAKLYECADKALYRSKDEGKNCASFYGESKVIVPDLK